MGISKKKTKKPAPIKSSPEHELELNKQVLGDLERRISMQVGSFLVLTEEGDPTQIALAQGKAKSEFLKFGPEMHKIAHHLGGKLPQVVDAFLESIDSVLHCNVEWLDEEKISKCYQTTQQLESELRI